MTRSRTIWLAALVALVSVALLVPAGSAQAAARSAPFCGSLNPGGGYDRVTLKPGQACTFWPVAVGEIHAQWDIVSANGYNGGVCLAVVQYPPGWPNGKPLSPTGSGPGNYWYCVNPGQAGTVWRAYNAFGAVYGQAVLLNYSSSTIRTWMAGDYGRIYYYA